MIPGTTKHRVHSTLKIVVKMTRIIVPTKYFLQKTAKIPLAVLKSAFLVLSQSIVVNITPTVSNVPRIEVTELPTFAPELPADTSLFVELIASATCLAESESTNDAIKKTHNPISDMLMIDPTIGMILSKIALPQ